MDFLVTVLEAAPLPARAPSVDFKYPAMIEYVGDKLSWPVELIS